MGIASLHSLICNSAGQHEGCRWSLVSIARFTAAGLAVAFFGCQLSGSTGDAPDKILFMRDLRPGYFPAMNFETQAGRDEIGSYESQLGASYAKHETDFKSGRFTTAADSVAFGLEAFYYGFMLTGNVTAIKDGNLTLEELLSHNRRFTETGSSEAEELRARMRRGGEILDLARRLRSRERRVTGAYWNNSVYSNRFSGSDLQTHESAANAMIGYALETGVDRTTGSVFPNYDLLITLITCRYTEDSAFTFKNPMMDSLLKATLYRLNPDSFLGLDGLSEEELAEFNFVGILGPIYRIDILLRKAQSLADSKDSIGMRHYLAIADSTDRFLTGKLQPLLDRWPYKETYSSRQVLLRELRDYASKLAAHDTLSASPNGETIFRSKDFRQAYQCYNCHRHPSPSYANP